MKLKENCLMEIYTDNEDSFSVGFYLSSFDNFTLFHLLDAQGKFDGIYLIKNDCIKNINYETEYLNKINSYIEFWNNKLEKNPFSIESYIKNFLTMEELLNYIQINNILSSFKLMEEKHLITGYIQFFEQNNIEIKTIDIGTAKEMEIISFAKEDIVLIEIVSIDNMLLNYAHLKKINFGN